MWNVNKDHIQHVKEELEGRRAAILARYESDVKSVEDDLCEIEELERMAYSFVAKHVPAREELAEAAPEPIAVLETGHKESIADVAADYVSGHDEMPTDNDSTAELESEDASESVVELLKRPIDADRLSLWRARRSPEAGQ